MWFLKGIELETWVPEPHLMKWCNDSGIRTFLGWGSDGKCLGWGISDDDYDKLIEIIKDKNKIAYE